MPRGRPKIGRQLDPHGNDPPPPPASEAPTTPTAGGTLLDGLPPPLPPAPPGVISAGGGPIPREYATLDIENAPAPWDLPGGEYQTTDARRFVEVPETWALRWMSQRHLDSHGSRDWQPVLAYPGDSRIRVKAPGMVTPSYHIRRGGQGGDLLYWMPRHWYDSRQRKKAQAVARATGKASDGMGEAVEQAQRSGYVRVDSARHPTHTQGEGASMRD